MTTKKFSEIISFKDRIWCEKGRKLRRKEESLVIWELKEATREGEQYRNLSRQESCFAWIVIVQHDSHLTVKQ